MVSEVFGLKVRRIGKRSKLRRGWEPSWSGAIPQGTTGTGKSKPNPEVLSGLADEVSGRESHFAGLGPSPHRTDDLFGKFVRLPSVWNRSPR
jgi:hypothetical protein